MPKKHQAASLVDLSLRSVGEFVAVFGKNLIQSICTVSKSNPQLGYLKLRSLLQLLKYHLSSNVPWHLHDRLAIEILRAVINLANEMKKNNDYTRGTAFLSEIHVAVSLTEVALQANLRTIEFTAWPKYMRQIFYNNLYYMTALQVLDLGSGSTGWRTADTERIIVNGVSNIPNLMSFTLCFDCTDNIITAVSHNCKKLQRLDVTASRSVTDRSVPALLKCSRLWEVKLCRTSVTITGFAELLLKHSSLENIGRCDEFGFVLEHIYEKESNFDKPLNLKAFESRNIVMEHLYLLIDMCPYITSLSIFRDERIDDLTILGALENLMELKLLSCDFYAHGINALLELKGSKIISLHLEHVDGLDLRALVYISQYCPRIKKLVFYNCEFLDRVATYSKKLLVPPFKSLESIKCVAECASLHLEYLLSHCTNIKFIQLGSSTGVGDSTMKRVFTHNQMAKLEELKILYSEDLSMKTVQLLMQNCENLRRLSELESWQNITEGELEILRNELKTNNIDLDISPTLSFA